MLEGYQNSDTTEVDDIKTVVTSQKGRLGRRLQWPCYDPSRTGRHSGNDSARPIVTTTGPTKRAEPAEGQIEVNEMNQQEIDALLIDTENYL